MFNVGDKVRVLNDDDDRFPKGSIQEVKSLSDDYDGVYVIDESSGLLFFTDVEKVDSVPVYDPREDTWSKVKIDLNSLPSVSDHIKIGGELVEQKKFSHERYQEIVNQTVEQINELSEKKGGEYAGDVDRLANFRRNANNLDLTMEDIWSVYAGKHWDAIQQYVKDVRSGKKRERLESISGRADDMIVYLILFKAMVEERGN